MPINPHTGAFASATDPDTWGTVGEARAYASDGAPEGIGFVFTDEDPLVGVDLDDCRDPEAGTLTDEAAAIVDRLDAYTEVSPSGTGVHVLVEGTLPEGRNRRGDVECYETARFFTVTGAHVAETPPTIAARTDAIDAIYRQYLAPASTESHAPGESHESESAVEPTDASESSSALPTGPTAPDQRAGHDLTDEALLERAQTASNGETFTRLWRGETMGYDSQSEADMALCALLAFWTGGDGDRVDRLFRDSGLMREKWDERHYADGATYGERTIERVLSSTDEVYEPPAGTDTDESAASDPSADGVASAASDSTASDSPAGVASGAPASQQATPGPTQAGVDGDDAATVAALQAQLETLREREATHLELIDELQEQVEQLEAENTQLRDHHSHAPDQESGTQSDARSLRELIQALVPGR